MALSKYTYRLDNGDTVYFLNGISEEFFKVAKENADKVEYLLKNEDDCKDTFPKFYEKMYAGKFLTNNLEQEQKAIIQKYTSRKEPNLFRLMVLPTYQCNLRCWYCTQEHENFFISDETVRRIKKLIDSKVQRPDIYFFTLSWFGGEPLICYETVVELTKYASEKCKEFGKVFNSDITTNSTLLNEKRIKELISLGITSYQITIDGCKDFHDKIKILQNESAFAKAMRNIELVAKGNAKCTIRFNYTHKNLNPEAIIKDLKSHLSQETLEKCDFMMYKVWQEDATLVDNGKVSILFNSAREIGLKPGFGTLGLCYADFLNFCCVFPNGKVSKCDNDNPKNLTSVLEEDGSISWTKQITDIPDVKPGDGSICSTCKYYPVCFGPCIGKRQHLKKLDTCVFNEPYVKEMLLNFCRAIDKNSI